MQRRDQYERFMKLRPEDVIYIAPKVFMFLPINSVTNLAPSQRAKTDPIEENEPNEKPSLDKVASSEPTQQVSIISSPSGSPVPAKNDPEHQSPLLEVRMPILLL